MERPTTGWITTYVPASLGTWPYTPPSQPVYRAIACARCRRHFCTVRTLAHVPIDVVCEGCDRERR